MPPKTKFTSTHVNEHSPKHVNKPTLCKRYI